MQHEEFEEFCDEKNMSKAVQDAFLRFLQLKYPNGIPAKINLDLAWRQYLAEATSKI